MKGAEIHTGMQAFSCPHSPDEGLLASARPFQPDVNVLHEGNAEFGTVHLFKQRHEHKSGDSLNDLIDVGRHRGVLISSLMQVHNLVAVLTEGTSREYAQSSEAIEWHNKYHEPRLLALFPDRAIPSNPSERQYVALATSGGCTLARFFMPQVPVHGTFLEAEGTPSPQVLLDPSAKRHWTYTQREQMAVHEVVSVLRGQTPGAHVALVYGAAHTFADLPPGLQPEEIPRVIAYHFNVPSSLDDSKRLQELCATDEAQAVTLAKEAPHVLASYWNQFSAAVQSIVSTKLRAHPDNYASPEDLLATLVGFIDQNAPEGSLRVDIQTRLLALYERNEGPFADLSLRPDVGALIIECARTQTFESAIVAERHPFTQLALLGCSHTFYWKNFSSLLSAKAQLQSLDKLFVSPHDAQDTVYQNLLEYARTDAVRTEVNRRWEAKARPFTA